MTAEQIRSYQIAGFVRDSTGQRPAPGHDRPNDTEFILLEIAAQLAELKEALGKQSFRIYEGRSRYHRRSK